MDTGTDKSNKIMFIIDGNSLINREYYGMPPLTSRSGIYTNAILGFINKLIKYIDILSPDYAAVAFDLPAPTFRHLEYAGYKASRKGMPEELAVQLPYVKEACDIFGFTVLTKEGYEADDILGTIAKKSEEIKTYILTGDRDSFQLVSDNVTVLYSSNTAVTEYNPQKILEDYGIEPKQLIDVKALMGDASDEIPGVKGIGEKTALKLIQENGSLNSVYDNLDNGTLIITPANKQKLIDGRENAFMSRRLAEIYCDVPIKYVGDDAHGVPPRKDIDKAKLYDFCKNLDLNSIIKKLNLSAAANLNEQIDMFNDDTEDIFDLLDNINTVLPEEIKSFNYELAAYVLNPVDGKREYTPSVELYNSMTKKLKEIELESLYYDVELPLASVLRDMEREGFLIDTDGLLKFGEELNIKANEIQKEVYSLAGVEFNINSPKQLGEVLFDKLKLPFGKKNKTGYSTDIDVMKKLKPLHPAIELILEYRAVTKLKSTYCDGLVKLSDSNGRLHTSFNQTITATIIFPSRLLSD